MTDKLEEAPAAGHNSVRVGGVDTGLLKEIIKRAENIADEMDERREDMKELMKEAKERGLDLPRLRRVLKVRRKHLEEYKRQLAETEEDLIALGML